MSLRWWSLLFVLQVVAALPTFSSGNEIGVDEPTYPADDVEPQSGVGLESPVYYAHDGESASDSDRDTTAYPADDQEPETAYPADDQEPEQDDPMYNPTYNFEIEQTTIVTECDNTTSTSAPEIESSTSTAEIYTTITEIPFPEEDDDLEEGDDDEETIDPYEPAENPADGFVPTEIDSDRVVVPAEDKDQPKEDSHEVETDEYVSADYEMEEFVPISTSDVSSLPTTVDSQPDSTSVESEGPEYTPYQDVAVENDSEADDDGTESEPSAHEPQDVVPDDHEVTEDVVLDGETAEPVVPDQVLHDVAPDDSLPDEYVPEAPCGSCLLPSEVMEISNSWLSSFSTGGLSELSHAATEDVQYWNEEFTYPGSPDPYASSRQELEGIIDRSAWEWIACTDITFDIVSAWSSCDRIALRWRQVGFATGKDKYSSVAPGTEITFSGIDLLKIDLTTRRVSGAETSADRLNYYDALDMNPFRSPDEEPFSYGTDHSEAHGGVDTGKEDKPATVKPPQDQPIHEQPKQEKPKVEQPKEIQPQGEKPKEEKPKEEKPQEEKPQEEKPQEEKPQEEKPQEEKPQEEKPKEEKPNEDESKEEKPKEDELKRDEPKEDKPKEEVKEESIEGKDEKDEKYE